ncbi:putative zinc finger protein [Orchesella cincta]|uniref:Putative zinc finger protein n=1 Tax=Orchesella cincta TaxID=48709 RepID=A0A1D2NKW3_ORCCI|nr:putative zinc finger protein [Orchesella cincta]
MSQKFCIICCYAFEEKQSLSIDDEAQENFSKFCKDLGFSFPDQTDGQSRNRRLRLSFGEAISVCCDCLSVIALYIQRRSDQLEHEKKVEELQKAVVKALEELSTVVKDAETQIDELHKIVRNGDESHLQKVVRNKESGDEVRTFREKVLLVSNEGFLNDNDMILPVISSSASVRAVKEEVNEPVCEDEYDEPYIPSPYVDDFTALTIETGIVNTDHQAQVPSFSKSKSKRCSVKKVNAKRKKKKSITVTETNTNAATDCEFNDNTLVKVDVDYEMTLPLAIRRNKRSIQSTTLIKRRVRESDCESDEDAIISDAGSNFSDCDFELQMLKGNQKSLSDENDSDSDSSAPVESASDSESIIGEDDIDFQAKPSKRKKKYKTKKAKVEGINSSKKSEAESNVNVEPFIDDPRKGYVVEYNAETQKLTVNGVEIIVDDTERSLKCTLCDFVINEAEAKKAVRARSVESTMQDHIAGTHFSCYKCEVCEKSYPTRTQFAWHRRTHREKRCICNICGRPFNTQYDMKRHKWRHMSKEEQEEAVRNGMKDFSKPWEDIKKKPLGFQCNLCGNQFRTIVQLKSHELRKHFDNRERIMCNKCGQFFLPGPSMAYHELNCLKEDLKQVHECYICLKRCKNKITLGRHIKLHSAGDETPFICSVCGKGMKSKAALKKHSAVHSDERPFVCKGCSASFKWKKHLVRHQKVSCKSCDATNQLFKEESH